LDSWQYVVRANHVLHNAVRISNNNREVKVRIKDTLVIHVVGETDVLAQIILLDLRPMGLMIYGNTDEMHVGGNMMKNNVFENVDAMIGLGVKDPH
jgi:hypothetical protein